MLQDVEGRESGVSARNRTATSGGPAAERVLSHYRTGLAPEALGLLEASREIDVD